MLLTLFSVPPPLLPFNMPLLSSLIIITLLLHECLLILILNDLALYKIALQNYILIIATDFIKEILVLTL